MTLGIPEIIKKEQTLSCSYMYSSLGLINFIAM
jgi:hypothetical protein